MEGSAVSLGPTALAARERAARGAARRPGERLGAERELAERLGVSRSTIRAALADLERGGVVRRTRGRGGGIFVAERKVERDLTSLAGLPAYLRRQGFQSDARVLSTATVEADAETAAALGLADGGARARGRARAARRRRADLARARAVPGRALPRPARPLARRLAVRAAADATTGSCRARRRSASRSSPPAPPRRGCSSCAAARRCWRSRARRGMPTGRPFERSHDLFRADRARIVVRARSALRAGAATRQVRRLHGGCNGSIAKSVGQLVREGPRRGEGDTWPPPSRTPGSRLVTRAPSSRYTPRTRASIA